MYSQVFHYHLKKEEGILIDVDLQIQVVDVQCYLQIFRKSLQNYNWRFLDQHDFELSYEYMSRIVKGLVVLNRTQQSYVETITFNMCNRYLSSTICSLLLERDYVS